MHKRAVTSPDIFLILNSIPGSHLILLADAPKFTIVDATDAYLSITHTNREDIVEKGLFEVFPDKPIGDPGKKERGLLDSLLKVVEFRKEDKMDNHQYALLNPRSGAFEDKVWQLTNKPVINSNGELQYIIHTAEDITVQIRSEQREEIMKGIAQAYDLFMQAPIAIHMVKGVDLTIQMANAPTLQYWGRGTEVIGRPLLEALPELKGQGYDEFLREVLRTGKTKEFYEAPITLQRNGKKETGYFNFVYKPYFEDNRPQPVGIVCATTEVTEKVLSKKQLEESESKYSTLFNTMDQGFCILEMIFNDNNEPVNYRFLEINPMFESQTGLKGSVGKTIGELVPNLESYWFERYGRVASTGEAERFTERSEAMGRWFDVYPFRLGGDESRKVAVLFTDVTERKKSEEAIKRSENNLLNIILQAPVAMAILKGPSFVVEIGNDRMFEIWGREKESLLNKSIFEGLPEVKHQGYEDLLNGVFTTGKTFSAFGLPVRLPRNGGIETVYINLLFEAFREGDGTITGIMAVAIDVTEQVVAKIKVEESNQELKFVTDFMPQIIWTTKPDGYHDFYNKQWHDYTGLSFDESKNTGWNTIVHPDDHDRALEVWAHSLKTGDPYEIEYRLKRWDGQYRWFLGRALPLRDEPGQILKWYGTGTDIDDQKKATDLLEDTVKERTRELQSQKGLIDNILMNSSNGISVTEMIRDERGKIYDAKTVLANDSAVKYVGLPKEVYLSKTAAELDPNVLSSPYGQTCLKTLETGEPAVIQYHLDITGRWLELTLSRMDDNHLIHIFTDVTSIKEAQLQLEKTIQDLKRSNANLEEFAYAASHDLKEPIRKIRVFSDRLKSNFNGRLLESDIRYFEKMEKATVRMQSLIDDLLDYSHVSTNDNYSGEIDLNRKVKLVLEDLELEIAEKNAKMVVGSLPVIRGNRRQMQQLFQNFITNSLKFSRPDIAPEIRINSSEILGKDIDSFLGPEPVKDQVYYQIEISDNGIGFQQEYAEQIFKMFQRLHNKTAYEGTGIGLAIVRKVVENHKGLIRVESQPGKGTTFKVLFPKDPGALK